VNKNQPHHFGFARLVGKLKKNGVRDPKALAASIGRKKYGAAEFQRMAAAGRKKKHHAN
jgi:hypothetical protein